MDDSRPNTPPPYLIVFFGAFVALGPLSMDAYLPAIPLMAQDFGVSIVSVNNTLSVFLLGYAVGQFFGGSISDQIGRKRVGYIGLSLYILATLSMSFVNSVDQMLWLRFFQAIGGGFSTVICMASVRDIYSVDDLGRKFATVTMIVLVAPLVAPALGALLLPLGWQSIFLFKVGYALLLLTLYIAFVPETRPGKWRDISPLSVFVQCYAVVTRRDDSGVLPIRYALAMALSISVVMIFVTNASFVYMEYFDILPSRFPLLFGISVLGFMSMNLFSMKRLSSKNADRFFRRGMLMQVVSAALLAAVVGAGFVSLWAVVLLIALTMSTLGLIGPAGSARYMSFFRQLAGSASSVYTTMMFSCGGLLGALTSVFNDGTLFPMVAVILLASVIANLVVWSLPAHIVRSPAG